MWRSSSRSRSMAQSRSSGNATCWSRISTPEPVHPRVGGDRDNRVETDVTDAGSSPRGRGTPFARRSRHPNLRFIPAWAGNASTETPTWPPWAVHPRVGGERARTMSCTAPRNGSSPRGRGPRQGQPVERRQRRFIPAWAGTAGRSRGPRAPAAVHPRVGGERENRVETSVRNAGSSPRGRGTPLHGLHRQVLERFIPAWAGTAYKGEWRRSPLAVHPRVGGERSGAWRRR